MVNGSFDGFLHVKKTSRSTPFVRGQASPVPGQEGQVLAEADDLHCDRRRSHDI